MIEDLLSPPPIPFKVHGRDKSGLDCWGLVMLVYSRLGITIPDFGASEDLSIVHQLINENKHMFDEIPEPEPWCFVTFMIRHPFVSHIGIVLPNKYEFLHIMQKRHVTRERLDDGAWNHRIRGFYRWKG